MNSPAPGLRKNACLALMALGLAVTSARAQVPEGDAAWGRGDYAAARAAYERVLVQAPDAGRANLRVGLMLAWDGRLDSALTHLTRARQAMPDDVDARLIEARVQSWRGRFDAAITGYDSVLAAEPAHREATLARAQTLAWAGRFGEAVDTYRAMLAKDSSDAEARMGMALVEGWRGDLPAAEREYQRVLAAAPHRVDALVGLGYIYFWQGRNGAALALADSALDADPENSAARLLRAKVRSARRPYVTPSFTWSNDSDDNTNFEQRVGASAQVTEAWRAFGSVAALKATDPGTNAVRLGAEAGASWTVGRFKLTAAAGARRLAPDSSPNRTVATYRGGASYRPVSALVVGVGYSRYPFDETAGLIARRLDLETVEGNADVTLPHGLALSGGAGGAWLSDGNHRTSFVLAATQRVRRGFTIGALGRSLAYARRGTGYFSPDRFGVGELRANYSFERGRWSGLVGGGLGAQQVGVGASAQSEWHLDGRVARGWGDGNSVELFGAITNSAVSSTTGAFRSRSLGLNVRLGL